MTKNTKIMSLVGFAILIFLVVIVYIFHRFFNIANVVSGNPN